MKRPSFQFYPSDWLRDTALRTCSIGARGLWMDVICYMHEGNPYGHLKVGTKVILPTNLAVMVGATLGEVEGWLNELESAEVFDRGEDGEIISRRMIRDENLRSIRAEGGKKGGNPALTGKGKVSSKVNLKDKQKPTPSSSSSTSSSSITPNPLQGDIDIDLIPKELTEKDMIPANVSRMRAKQKGMMRVKGNTPTMARIGSWFRRGEKTLWSVAELESFLIVNPTPQEINGMEQLYTDKDLDPAKFGYRRQSLITLLNNWHQELDNARKYAEHLEAKRNQ